MEQIIEVGRYLFSVAGLAAYWECGLWTEPQRWITLISTTALGLAYVAVPVIMVGLTAQKNTPLFKKIYYLFAAFIFVYGLTIFMEALLSGPPVDRISVVAKFVTAIISWITAFTLLKMAPEILSLKNPHRPTLEIEVRKQMESELQHVKSSLELEIANRTSTLEKVNQQLKNEIMERSAKELRIRESEERFRSLVESSPNAIVLTDERGTIRLVNRQTEILFGYQRSELIGQTLEILVPKRFRNVHVHYRSNFYQDPQTRPMGKGRELYALHKQGNEIAVEIGLTTLRSENKLMVLSTIVDITDRKKNEENLVQKNAELAKYNEELKTRTAQLIQSEKMSALGTLIAGIAHELNNPITGILNYAQYCRKNIPPDGKVAEVLDDLVFEAKRCAEIVKDLLTYSYFSLSDKRALEETCNVTDVTKRVCNILAHHLKNITVYVKIEDMLPAFPIQANKLQQVLSNIVKNSIDAMENSSKKEIHIQAFQDDTHLHLTIQDTGSGILPENLTRIFDPFYTTKEVGKGTGLGLSVSKSIIEEARGKISVASAPGQGCTFYLLFPKASGSGPPG